MGFQFSILESFMNSEAIVSSATITCFVDPYRPIFEQLKRADSEGARDEF
jgi:hypothetical protein